MGGAARIAARREIFKFTTFAHVAGLEMMPKKISLRFARLAIEPDTYSSKLLDY